jgi:hypothetical protein
MFHGISGCPSEVFLDSSGQTERCFMPRRSESLRGAFTYECAQFSDVLRAREHDGVRRQAHKKSA